MIVCCKDKIITTKMIQFMKKSKTSKHDDFSNISLNQLEHTETMTNDREPAGLRACKT